MMSTEQGNELEFIKKNKEKLSLTKKASKGGHPENAHVQELIYTWLGYFCGLKHPLHPLAHFVALRLFTRKKQIQLRD